MSPAGAFNTSRLSLTVATMPRTMVSAVLAEGVPAPSEEALAEDPEESRARVPLEDSRLEQPIASKVATTLTTGRVTLMACLEKGLRRAAIRDAIRCGIGTSQSRS